MLRSIHILLVSVILLGQVSTTSPAQAAPDVPVFREFKSWLIGCDNTRSCVALTFPSDDEQSKGFIRIERRAGGSAAPEIALAVYQEAAEGHSPMNVEIDGAAVAGVPSQTAVTDNNVAFGFSIARLAPRHVAPLLEALRDGNQLKLVASEGTGQEFSLVGSAAALLFMDDVQGRVGTETALARPGTRPASTVPVAISPPRVVPFKVPQGAAADPAFAPIVREKVADYCDPLENSPFESSDADRVNPLGDDKVLVSLMCSWGVYNLQHIYFVVDGGNARQAQPIEFPRPERQAEPDGSAPEYDYLTNGEFNPDSGLLSFFDRGRGSAADCGMTGTYAWTGIDFELVEYRRMPVCRGVPEPFWPVLWRATTR